MIFFTIFTYVVAVVLLNLLIAKMNASYAAITEDADQAHMAGRATMIVAWAANKRFEISKLEIQIPESSNLRTY